MEKAYIAFYTTRPFWAGKPLNLNKPETRNHFTNLMSEVVFSYKFELFTFEVCKDGMLMIHMKNLETQVPSISDSDINTTVNWWAQYLNYVNCLNFLLDSSVLEVDNHNYLELSEITNKDAIRIIFENGKMKRCSIASESLNSLFQMLRYPAAIPFKSVLSYARIENRIPFRKAIFDLTADKFSHVVKDNKFVEMLSGMTKSIVEYKVGNYSVSIVFAWFVIESMLNSKWKRFLDEKNMNYHNGSKRINTDRRNRFMGRDYPISVVINVLELSDILSFSLFKDIDTVRGYRNNVMHQEEGYKCDPDQCKLAINTALKLALEGQSVTITPNLSYSIHMS